MIVQHVPFYLLMATAALALGACQRSPDAVPTTASSSAISSNPLTAENTRLIKVTPNSLTSCTPDSVGLTWDLHGSYPSVQTIDIFVGEGASAKLFTEDGPSGKSRTGQWVYPGTVFTLKDKADGKQLDRVRIGGPNCPT